MKRGDAQAGGPELGHSDPLPHKVFFARAAGPLAPYLAGYHSYVIESAPGARFEEIFFPAWANIRFQTWGEPWWMRIAGRRFGPIPSPSLFGPTGHAGFSEFGRGATVGVGITPRGWARLFGGDVSRFTDQVVPLATLLGDAVADALQAGVMAAADFDGQVAVIEAHLLERFEASAAEPPEVHTLQQLLTDPAIATVDQAIAAIGIARPRFVKLCHRHFGFAPKRLIRRARFMRTLMALRANPGLHWADLLDPAYHDQSHFIRDCQDFVGMAPGQILARTLPVGATSMAERTRILGAPVQALQRDGD